MLKPSAANWTAPTAGRCTLPRERLPPQQRGYAACLRGGSTIPSVELLMLVTGSARRPDRIRVPERQPGPGAPTPLETPCSRFANALRAALREDPDVILVGEMRSRRFNWLAAETSVFGTLHTSSAAQTVDRMVDVFPPEQQTQIREHRCVFPDPLPASAGSSGDRRDEMAKASKPGSA